jgi:hypothetical protein
MTDFDFYTSLPDYEEIKDYLELDPEGYEIPVDLPPFQAGTKITYIFGYQSTEL